MQLYWVTLKKVIFFGDLNIITVSKGGEDVLPNKYNGSKEVFGSRCIRQFEEAESLLERLEGAIDMIGSFSLVMGNLCISYIRGIMSQIAKVDGKFG